MTDRECAEQKAEFVEIYRDKIKREGSEDLLRYLMSESSDFFIAPASTRYHGAEMGGLCRHSLNVYDCLRAYLDRERVKALYGLSGPDYTDESIAIVALLHDLCKIGCYRPGFRNVKDDAGVWQRVPYYEFSDPLPYGHGEKSVYILSGFIRLTREEAFAIRYHMGFSNEDDVRNVGAAFEMFPLALAVSIADTEATYYLEGKPKNVL